MPRTRAKKESPPTPTSASTDALDEVVRLNDAELRLAMAYRRKHDELAVVKSARGDAVLDAADPDGAARESGRQVAALREELDSLADAARRARERRIAAIPAVFHAESDAKVRQAEQLEVEAAKLHAESDRLRQALEAHDDWAYVAASPVFPERTHGAQQGGSLAVVDARGPNFMRLRRAADALRSQAAQGRFRVAHQAGSVGGDSVEDLVSNLHSDPMRIAPSAGETLAWIESAIGSRNTNAPMRYHLEWVRGVINTGASHVIPFKPGTTEVRVYASGSNDTGRQIDAVLGEPVGALAEAE